MKQSSNTSAWVGKTNDSQNPINARNRNAQARPRLERSGKKRKKRGGNMACLGTGDSYAPKRGIYLH
jgi:hypothetical protein